MKGKFRLLGHIGLVLFVVSALMLTLVPAVPVAAATAVTNVWVEFPYTTLKNATSSTSNIYYVHFKPTTALVRGIDYVTVTFPDGTSTMGGTGSAYAFTVASTMGASEVSFSTDYGTLGSDANWYQVTSSPTVGGYRAKVKVPINISAGTDVWVKFDSDDITSASTEASSYKVYVQTTKDTTPVLSSAFALGDSATTTLATTVSPSTAGAAAQYSLSFVSTTALTADTDTVSIMFPIGTTLPSSISASNVQFSSDGSTYTAAGTTPTVDTNTRTITATTSVSISGSGTCYVRVLSGAGVTNPTTASTTAYKCMVRTSQDGKWVLQSSAHTISAGNATKVVVANGAIGLSSTYYSDDATMTNMYSSRMYLVLTDDYGNAKAPSSAVTVTLSSSSSSGAFYTNASADGSGAMTSATSISLDAATPDEGQTVYYKDTAAGTYTFTFAATSYTSGTWTFKVAPAVSLYDSSNNLVSTYAPTSTSPTAETGDSDPYTQKYSADYINSAISAAMAGDTVKLGDGIYEVDSDSYIQVSKKITLTSVNGASYTTIRNTAEIDKALEVTTDGTATNPIIIEKLTFQRLRATVDIDMAIRNAGNDYVTVQNCVFNNIEPDENSASEGVVWFTNTDTITSATISNNTFNSCVTTWPDMGSGAKSGCIIIDGAAFGGTSKISGVTISGNTLTNCSQYGITFGGYSDSNDASGTISNNTITNGYSSIDLCDYIGTLSVTGNTITSPYSYGIKIEGNTNDTVTIKNNTITGSAGSYAVRIDSETGTGITIQYNDIYNTNTEGYAISSGVAASSAGQDCKYNYFGSATGPYYSALTGATVTKSNPNGTGDKITDKVTYYPWLHKSRADVVADNASYQASTMKLVSGWNTLSTPVKLISTADAIDELITSGMTIGYYYDATGWHQITSGYVLNPCDAVYVKMSAVTYVLLKFDASAFSTPSKSLSAGWNLISMAALDSDGKYDKQVVASVYKTAAGLPGYSQVVSPSLNATQTDMYGNAGTSWTYSVDETTGAGTNYMFAGLGYWCYMQNAATLAGFEITPIAPDLD
jgi:hypothetical protein